MFHVPTYCYISLNSNSKGHVDGGTEGHRRHGIEDGHINLGEEDGVVEPVVYKGHGRIGMYWYIKHYISEIEIYQISPASTATKVKSRFYNSKFCRLKDNLFIHLS